MAPRGLHGCDFRPHFDGYLHNLFTTIIRCKLSQRPKQLFATLHLRWQKWVLSNREQFGQEPVPINRWLAAGCSTNGRQVIKAGGDFNAIQQLIDDQELVQVRERWADLYSQTTRSGNNRMQRSRRRVGLKSIHLAPAR